MLSLKHVHKNDKGFSRMRKIFSRDWQLYLLCLPTIIYIAIFEYGPMYGIQLAFRNFRAREGIWGSPWVGFDNFRTFFDSFWFNITISNTLIINIYSLLVSMPIAIFIALLFNQTRNAKFKKMVQTTLYAPHFISVVVMAGMIILFLSPQAGIVNVIIQRLGGEPVHFMAQESMFHHMFVWTGVWQGTGWATIIYVAALSGVNPELYEAARIDGANKANLIRYIDIPSIAPTMIIVLILNLGSMMSLGFQRVFLLQNPHNLMASEVISTYVYRISLVAAHPQFGLATAVGLFNTAINVCLLLAANWIARRASNTSLF